MPIPKGIPEGKKTTEGRESVNVISAVAVRSPSNERIQNCDTALSFRHVSLGLFLIIMTANDT